MASPAATEWLRTQLPAMEQALQALVNINSFTLNTAGGREVGTLLLELFRGLPMAAEVVPSREFADHLVFRSQGRAGGRPVLLVGHLDTVFPPGVFEGYRAQGDRRVGPGVLDMKGGLVVIAWALRAVQEAVGLQAIAPVKVVIVSDEEVGSPEGAPLITREAAGAQAALVFESGRENDAIVTRRKGVGAVKVIAHGKAAHAGNNHADGANAIWALARFVEAAQLLTDAAAGVTVNVGTITGGTAKNTVPAEASAELDLRFPDAASMKALFENLERAAASNTIPGTRLELQWGISRSPLEKIPGSEALMQQYAKCAEAHGLRAGEAPLQGGGSDANTTSALGIPSIDGLGPRGRFFHTPQEYIELDTLVSRAAALARWLIDHS